MDPLTPKDLVLIASNKFPILAVKSEPDAMAVDAHPSGTAVTSGSSLLQRMIAFNRCVKHGWLRLALRLASTQACDLVWWMFTKAFLHIFLIGDDHLTQLLSESLGDPTLFVPVKSVGIHGGHG